MAQKEDYEEHEQAPFNMALDTLKRLGEILREIKMISVNPTLPREDKLEVKISLVKSFFINSVPLLEEKYIEKNKDNILALVSISKKIAHRTPYGSLKVVGYENSFNPELDLKLDNLLVELQIELQKKGHFMPPPDTEGGWD
jgi:hypothetical protein